MAENESPKPDAEHLARFRKVMTALVAVTKDEAFRAKLTLRANVVAATAATCR
jgi:hypothetical protein